MSASEADIREAEEAFGWDREAFIPTSPSDQGYNCIAWALCRNDIYFWPGKGSRSVRRSSNDFYRDFYWPQGLINDDTPEAFEQFFGMAVHGYRRMAGRDVSLQPGLEKLALYTLDEGGLRVAHAARQLPSGWWTSKLGGMLDISHPDPDFLLPSQGTDFFLMSRPRRPASWRSPLFPPTSRP